MKSLPTHKYTYICACEFFKKSFASKHSIEPSVLKIINYDDIVEYETSNSTITVSEDKKLISVFTGSSPSGLLSCMDVVNYAKDISDILEIPQKLEKYYELKFKNHIAENERFVFRSIKRKLDDIRFPIDSNIHIIAQNTAIAVCFNYIGGGTFELFEHQIPVILLSTDYVYRHSVCGSEGFSDIWNEPNFLLVESVSEMWRQIELMTDNQEYRQSIIDRQNIAVYGQTTPKKFEEFGDIL
jgi:hypothetical protein